MTVVVGVSPTTGSPSALRWAAEEARLRKVPLRAVLAWRAPRPPAAPAGRPPADSLGVGVDHEAQARQRLHGFVATALGTDDEVDCVVVRGTAVNALLASARDADVLVIGEPRTGRLASVRASLVAPQVVLRAGCPVVVMPGSSR